MASLTSGWCWSARRTGGCGRASCGREGVEDRRGGGLPSSCWTCRAGGACVAGGSRAIKRPRLLCTAASVVEGEEAEEEGRETFGGDRCSEAWSESELTSCNGPSRCCQSASSLLLCCRCRRAMACRSRLAMVVVVTGAGGGMRARSRKLGWAGVDSGD